MAWIRPWLFPLGVICLYGIGLIFAPKNTGRSIHICISMFQQLTLPICLALVMMIVFNRMVSPGTITRFLGQGSGLKGIFLSSLAGIVSMGPVYAWYPLFKTLKDKGVSVFNIANFIGNRSIKPALLPVMVTSFGWNFTSAFVLMSLVGALIVAGVVSMACPLVPEPDKSSAQL
jgi:uncharacterized membrane protein YraQ (UPF0718 family)